MNRTNLFVQTFFMQEAYVLAVCCLSVGCLALPHFVQSDVTAGCLVGDFILINPQISNRQFG